ncbi:hypothetical protein ABD76_17305 [Paenibacillus dendritiformis]|uniref:hypothetical protein n=1 Tax=Paenibacillus dendritiformis TaxID=130049 RepID=UPI0018CE0D42|nr:hypothetical protein [Paenibacillus dendritiformis]MBG9794166.1 hypothetical protein [Paenibacillus dendritiformis]
MRKAYRKVLAVSLIVVLLGVGGVAIWGFNTKSNLNKNTNSYVRKATPEELEDDKSFHYIKTIGTKHGNFRLVESEEKLPADGIVYNTSDIDKHTKMVIINDRKYIRVD